MFTAADIDDVAGEQLDPNSVEWMRREAISPDAMLAMFDSIGRMWEASDKTADDVTDLCGQAFRLGWESHKGAC